MTLERPRRRAAGGSRGLWLPVLLLGLLSLGLSPAAGQGVPAPMPGTAPQVTAEVTAERVVAALGLDQLAEALAAEIVTAGDPLGPPPAAAPGQGADAGWRTIAGQVAPVGRIRAGLRAEVGRALETLDPAARAAIEPSLVFWESDLGRRVLALEFAAREAMADPAADAAARAEFAAAAGRELPRVEEVRQLIAAADLVEPAVAASMNVALAVMEGIADGADLPPDLLTADVWDMEPEIRADQAAWIEALIFLATGPLDGPELDRLIAETATPGGQRLNRIVDGAATAVLVPIARDLGRASAHRSKGSRL